MTAVVGVRGKSGVLLAADTQFSGFNMNRQVADPKTFALSEVLAVAYCGSGRLGQIIMHHVMDSLDDPPLGMDEHYWAVRYFVDELRAQLEARGHLHVDSFGGSAGVEHLGSSAFLLAVRGRLFNVQEDFDVMEHELCFDALGSGEEVAIGAMRSLLTKKEREKPLVSEEKIEEVARAGIAAAVEHTNYVGGKEPKFSFTVLYTDEERATAKKVLAGEPLDPMF